MQILSVGESETTAARILVETELQDRPYHSGNGWGWGE